MMLARLSLAAILAVALLAQEQARLNPPEALALFRRATQLIESTSSVVPGLARASAPVQEDARQSLAILEQTNAANTLATYELLAQLRSYLALADSIPKPYPFPEAGRKQFAEFRDAVERIEMHFRALLDFSERQVLGADRDNLARYHAANEQIPKARPDNPRVVFLGDSITDGWRLNEYFPERDFVNRGIGGQTSGQMLGRMKADVIDLKPQAVVVLAGTNDLARGVAVETIKNNLTMISELAAKNRIKVLLASILPVSDYHKGTHPSFERTLRRQPAKIVEINNWLKAYCAANGHTYVDYHSKLIDGSGYIFRDAADDGLHPNAKGYRMMAPIVLEATDRTLGRPKTKRSGN